MTLKDSEILEKLHKFNMRYWCTKYNFCLAVEKEGEITLYERLSQPCWGELRTHYDDIPKPGDLKKPFPEGTPVAIAIPFSSAHSESFFEFVTNKEISPWRKALGEKGVDFTFDKKQKKGFVLTDTKIDPSVFVQMLMMITHTEYIQRPFEYLLEKGVDPKLACLIVTHIGGREETSSSYDWNSRPETSYYFIQKTDLARWRDNNPCDITSKINKGRKTFYSRAAYNRKEIQNVWFSDEAVNLAKELNLQEGVFLTDEELFELIPKMEKLITKA